MERVVLWRELCALIEPVYPKPRSGRPPIGVERMLRIYFLQHWFNLPDLALEEALYESLSMRRFVGIDLGREPVPDETTMYRFRHLLEQQQLAQARSWMPPSLPRPVQPRTPPRHAIRRCTRPARASNGISG
jgi:IS5 family transposase